MTKLIVRPIDMNEPGSWRERRRLFAVIKAATTASKANDGAAAIAALEDAEALVLPRLRTDDGTPVEDILAELSATKFDELFAKILGGGEPAPSNGHVPEASDVTPEASVD